MGRRTAEAVAALLTGPPRLGARRALLAFEAFFVGDADGLRVDCLEGVTMPERPVVPALYALLQVGTIENVQDGNLWVIRQLRQ